MLPDYPELKRELEADLTRQFRQMVSVLAPLAGGIRSYCQAEGDKFTFETAEGKLVTKEFARISAKFEIPGGLSSAETHEEFMRRAGEAAQSIARQQSGILYSTIEQETENKIDAGGKPFDPMMMWDMVEKMWVDFDENTGEPKMPVVHMHPEMFNAIQRRLPQWEADPDLQKRRTEVLRVKKEEWRDRESRRKLVG